MRCEVHYRLKNAPDTYTMESFENIEQEVEELVSALFEEGFAKLFEVHHRPIEVQLERFCMAFKAAEERGAFRNSPCRRYVRMAMCADVLNELMLYFGGSGSYTCLLHTWETDPYPSGITTHSGFRRRNLQG